MSENKTLYVGIEDPVLLDKIQSLCGAFDVFSSVETLENYADFKESLGKESSFIIVDTRGEKFKSVLSKASDHHASQGGKIVFIVDPESLEDEKLASVKENLLPDSFKLIEFSTLMSDILEQKSKEYIPITINNYFKVSTFPCETFIKLGSQKYVKVANAGDPVEIDFIDKYRKRKVDILYVSDSDFYEKCIDLFSSALVSEDLVESKEELVTKSQEVLHGMIKDLGVSQYITGKTEEMLGKVESELQNPKLGSVLELFKQSKGSFIYDHSYLTMVFCSILCKHMDWENEQVRKKLALACMFHDLGIDNPKKAFYESSDLSNIKSLNQDLSKEILDHPTKMAKLLEADPNMPQEVINIVLNHHEGLGPEESYPKGASGVNITQLECLFIVAHGFVVELYKIAFNPKKIDQAVQKVVENYTSGNFKAVIEAFKIAVEEEIKPLI